jgi:hypothetical protein
VSEGVGREFPVTFLARGVVSFEVALKATVVEVGGGRGVACPAHMEAELV